MFEILHYSFMIRALIAGVIIGLMAPVMGTFLIAKRYSVMADSLAHVSLAGVALGVWLGFNPVWVALSVSIVAALAIERLRTQRQISGELSLAVFMSAGLALAVVLLGLRRSGAAAVMSYLFGSITTVSLTDTWVITGLGLVVLSTLFFFYKEFVYLSFDEEAAQVSGLSTTRLNTLLMILTATTVSLSLRIVGALLIGALMIIPVVTAMQLKTSFTKTIFWAMGLGVTAVVLGLVAAFYINLPAGGSIVLCSLLLFGAVTLIAIGARTVQR